MTSWFEDVLKRLKERTVYLMIENPEKPGEYRIIGTFNLDKDVVGEPDFIEVKQSAG